MNEAHRRKCETIAPDTQRGGFTLALCSNLTEGQIGSFQLIQS